MKSYTDIAQSKKLAEILPIESADMFYRDSNSDDVKLMWEHVAPKVTTPCWSLAALLAQIPNPILRRIDEGWQCEDSHGFNWETCQDDPIDACVEMIVQLHKDNQL